MAKRKISVQVCAIYNETLLKYPKLVDKLQNFVDLKMNNPAAQFGSNDSVFTAGGPLGKLKIKHAHLSQNESILYRMSGDNLYLFGIFNHADTGTSTTSSSTKQKSLASRLSHQYPELAEYVEQLATLLESKIS
jgi:hypothetical protein